MNRILISIAVILGSVALYLCLRVFKKYKVTAKIQNAIMFIPTGVIFLIRSILQGELLWIGRNKLMIMIPVCFLFSRLPNLMSLKSLQGAPNPGYSLMIAKSYVALAALVAVPLLGSTLTITDGIAILLIIGFMSLILISPKSKHEFNSTSWIRKAIYAHIGRAGLALASTWFIREGISPLVVNTWIFCLVSIIILLEGLITKTSLIPPKKSLFPVIGVVLAMVIFNWSLQEGYATAPNPGYINAANASSIAVLTLVSGWIFGDELSLRKLIGIFGVVVGISILFIF